MSGVSHLESAGGEGLKPLQWKAQRCVNTLGRDHSTLPSDATTLQAPACC
jgi:hypothetical protein